MLLPRRKFLKLAAVTAGLPTFSQILCAQQTTPAPPRGDSILGLLSDSSTTPLKIRLPFVMRGSKDSSKVALTYDDGPTPGVTDVILEQLSSSHAKATFFVIGQRARAHPALARRIVEEGHEIANHSYTHPDLAKLPDVVVSREIQDTQRTIEDICGVTPRYFRPPYGSFRATQGAIARACRLQVIIWSIDPQDWRKPGAATIAARVTSPTAPGDIILCHDLHSQTAAASRLFIPRLAENFSLVSLSSLLRG